MGITDHRIGPQLLGLDNCPHCGRASPTLLTVWHSQQPTTRTDGQSSSVWAAFRCTTCGGIVTARGKKGDTGNNPVVYEVFPNTWEAHEAIPSGVTRFLKQAKQSLSNHDASVLMSAAAIDAMLKHKGLTDGSLHKRIGEAVANGLITQGMADWAHVVRLGANDTRHADVDAEPMTFEDAQRAFDYAEALMEVVYVLPSRMPAPEAKT